MSGSFGDDYSSEETEKTFAEVVKKQRDEIAQNKLWKARDAFFEGLFKDVLKQLSEIDRTQLVNPKLSVVLFEFGNFSYSETQEIERTILWVVDKYELDCPSEEVDRIIEEAIDKWEKVAHNYVISKYR